MKVLVISRGGGEIERCLLNQPMLVAGRSPVCDIVLRAPGIAPLQFLIEWVGAGDFSPDQGQWAVFDISDAQGGNSNPDEATGEGIILSDGQKPVALAGVTLGLASHRLESTPEIGGWIKQNLASAKSITPGEPEARLLEVVQVRRDSGAVIEVLHLPPERRRVPVAPLKKTPTFKIEWNGSSVDSPLRILLSEMPGAAVLNRGQRVTEGSFQDISPRDLIMVRWREHDFFVRFVPKLEVAPAPRQVVSSPLLRKLLWSVLLPFGLAFGFLITRDPPPPPPPPEAPRIARVEVKEVAPEPPPPAANLPPTPTTPPPIPEAKSPPIPKMGLSAAIPLNKSPGQVAAARFQSAPGKKRLGLNSPAPVTNINRIGILGALGKGSGPKGPGVRADMMMNDGLVTQAASGDSANIVIKNPPGGTIGTGKTGGGGSGGDLSQASTTLQGARDFDPKSTGPIAAAGGKSGNSIGTSLGGSGSGLGKGSELGTLDTSEMSVSGGLDRETVRRIIAGYRGRVRVCYERALVYTPQLAGRIVYKWLISAKGPVLSAEMLKSGAASPALESCVLNLIKSMVFPAATSGVPTTVIYPFEFQAQ